MTQPSPALDQGEDELDDTELAPSPESEDASDSWTNILADAVREEAQATAPLPEVEEEAPADEADGPAEDRREVDPEGDEAEPAAPSAKLSREEEVRNWVEQVTANPKSINEVAPAKFHPQIFEAFAATEKEVQLRAATLAHQQGLQQGREQAHAEIRANQEAAEVAATVQTIDEAVAAAKQDPNEAQALVAWQSANPDAWEAYTRYKREGPPDPRQAQQQQAMVVQQGQTSQQQLMQLLNGYPEAEARIRAKHGGQPYGYSSAEIARLANDIAEEKATDLVKAKTPVIAAAAKRVAGTESRTAVPKPRGGGATGAQPDAPAGDYKSLIAAGFREENRRS